MVLEAAKEKKLISADQHGQLGLRHGGARQRHAVHHEPQRALGAVGERSSAGLGVARLLSCPHQRRGFDLRPNPANRFDELGAWRKSWASPARCWSSDPGMRADRLSRPGRRAAGRSRHRDIPVPRFRRRTRIPKWSRRAACSPPRTASTRWSALGGGSSLDCAKGINFVLTNGGNMRDYWGFGKAVAADAADDRRSDHGRHRQRGAKLRADLRRRDAREDGVRRSEGRLSRGDSRSAADALAAARGDRHRRLRRHLARGGKLRDHATQPGIARFRARGLATAVGTISSACCAIPAIWKRAAPCCSARTTPASPSRIRCWAPRTPAPIR